MIVFNYLDIQKQKFDRYLNIGTVRNATSAPEYSKPQVVNTNKMQTILNAEI